jgi:MYXO-CTERM domain-containing protein
VQVSPATPVFALSGANTATPTFTAPEVTADTDFVFQLAVSDGIAGTPSTATTTVTVRNVNRPPVAVATAPAFAAERSAITLDGSGSFDADGQPLTYRWTAVSALPTGGSLANANQALATFNTGDVTGDTDVTFQLVVNDGVVDGAAATVTVTVHNVDRAPVASLIAPLSASSDQIVTLNGSGSSDPDGDALTFLWTQTGGPGVVLENATSAKPTFVAPDVKKDTTLTFVLRVSDGTLVSAPATASIVIHKKGPKGDRDLAAGTRIGETPAVSIGGPAASGGCATGGAGTFTPLLGLFGLLLMRRRRAA